MTENITTTQLATAISRITRIHTEDTAALHRRIGIAEAEIRNALQRATTEDAMQALRFALETIRDIR